MKTARTYRKPVTEVVHLRLQHHMMVGTAEDVPIGGKGDFDAKRNDWEIDWDGTGFYDEEDK